MWKSTSALFLCFFIPRLFTLASAGTYGQSKRNDVLELPRCSAPNVCLTPPPPSSHLVMVLLGVGTQNFTCTIPTSTNTVPASTQTPTSTPLTAVANGAKATIYDISCLATTKSALPLGYLPKLSMLTRLASVPSLSGSASVPDSLGYPEVGRHFFSPNAQTPVFEVKKGSKKLKFVGQRLEAIPAPADAMSMSADWLKLGVANGEAGAASSGIKFIYRLNVAGGKPAADICKDRKPGEEVTVPYSTQYWVFN